MNNIEVGQSLSMSEGAAREGALRPLGEKFRRSVSNLNKTVNGLVGIGGLTLSERDILFWGAFGVGSLWFTIYMVNPFKWKFIRSMGGDLRWQKENGSTSENTICPLSGSPCPFQPRDREDGPR